MAVSKKMDTFANVAAIIVAESVAGTVAYAKFAFPFSIQDKTALLLARIEYWFGNMSKLDAEANAIYGALIAAPSVVDLTVQSDPVMIDSARVQRVDFGTAGSGQLINQPFVKDFSDLPGGGLLVAPSPLYAAVQGVGASSAVSLWMRMYYTYMQLSTEEYWQLVESRRIISS